MSTGTVSTGTGAVRAMRELFRTLPLMCVVLLVPVIPFLFLGG